MSDSDTNHSNYVTTPSPSRRCASFTVGSGDGGRPEAESLLDVNGWDRLTCSAAAECFGSWTDGALLREAANGPDDLE